MHLGLAPLLNKTLIEWRRSGVARQIRLASRERDFGDRPGSPQVLDEPRFGPPDAARGRGGWNGCPHRVALSHAPRSSVDAEKSFVPINPLATSDRWRRGGTSIAETRRLGNVSTQTSLHASAYNIKRTIDLLGSNMLAIAVPR